MSAVAWRMEGAPSKILLSKGASSATEYVVLKIWCQATSRFITDSSSLIDTLPISQTATDTLYALLVLSPDMTVRS